jgi:hypothetical protein
MITLDELQHHDPGFDAAGNAVLIQKPFPAGFNEAPPGDRLCHRRAVEREANAVAVAAAHAIMPSRPAGYENWPATSRRAWWLKAEQAAKGNHR